MRQNKQTSGEQIVKDIKRNTGVVRQTLTNHKGSKKFIFYAAQISRHSASAAARFCL